MIFTIQIAISATQIATVAKLTKLAGSPLGRTAPPAADGWWTTGCPAPALRGTPAGTGWPEGRAAVVLGYGWGGAHKTVIKIQLKGGDFQFIIWKNVYMIII